MKYTSIILACAISAYMDKASADDDYDAIVVGAGAAGCPLAQTLAEGGLKTLLIERGSEPPDSSNNKAGFADVLRSECIESFSSGGVVVSTGNCMGGATSINQGIFIEETDGWFEENFPDDFFNAALIRDAYEWVRERVAPEPASQNTVEGQLYTEELIKAMDLQDGIDVAVDVDEATVPEYGIWRPHTIFDNADGTRFSADTLLDRDNENLIILTNTEVKEVSFTKENGSKYSASCVQFKDGTEACIKKKGRIYLSAGAFHTPELLMRSGIKDGGEIYDNAEVGKNLSDKPGTFASTFFKEDFDYDEITLADVSATKAYSTINGEERTLLFEDSSTGNGEALNLVLYEKTFVPRGERDSVYADLFIKTSDCCLALSAGLAPSLLIGICAGTGIILGDQSTYSACAGLSAFAPCLSDVSFLAAFVADPASTGAVTLDEDGELVVDVNYLDDLGDLDAFGEAAKTAYLIKNSMDTTKDSAPQTVEDPCPSVYQTFTDDVLEAGGIVNPFNGTVSAVQPNILEALLAQGATNIQLGSVLSQSAIISPHHFAGTARVGDVINEEFKVKGVDNLYVADASALPKTARVNTMATTMMIGRIAGATYVNDRNARD